MALTTAHRGAPGWLGLAGFAAVTVAAAGVGALAALDAGTAYEALHRPMWAPPPWLFGPVWTVLYGTIALAGWLVWRRTGLRDRQGWRKEMVAFGIQLGLNALWTPLFFGAHWYGLALLDVALLWVVICLTVALFARVYRPAGLLLLPYWAWVSFATVLTAVIWHLN
jgi:tryptophan-rich sensory protein